MSDLQTLWNPALGRGDWLISTPVAGASPAILTDDSGDVLTNDLGDDLTSGSSIGITNVDLVVGQDLVSAALISVFTDRTAPADAAIPDRTSDPRGWWGDLDQDQPIGSRLWLRERSKATPQTLALVKGDLTDCVQWMITDGVVASVTVNVEWTRPGMLGAQMIFTRQTGSQVAVNFAWTWQGIE